MTALKNPGLRTLLGFLSEMDECEPVGFTGLGERWGKGYGMLSRYLGFCLEQGLIRVVEVSRGRGRYLHKKYEVSPKGRRLLKTFEQGLQ